MATPAALAQDCDVGTRASQLEKHLADAESAWTAFESDRFAAELDETRFILPCLDDAISPKLASKYHLMVALKLHGDGDTAAAARALQASRWANPDYELPTDYFPEGNPIRVQFEHADPSLVSVRSVPEPRGGRVAFDGKQDQQRPRNQPALFQVIDRSDVVQQTHYLLPDQRLPDYRAIPKIRNALLMASAGAALTSAGMGVGALVNAGRFDAFQGDPNASADQNEKRLTGFQGRSTVLVVSSSAFAGLSVVGLGSAVAVGQR